MITWRIHTSPRSARARPSRRLSDRRAYTLFELAVATTLSLIVVTGVLTTFLTLVRSELRAANYSMSEAEIRRALEEFNQDTRMASAITWNSATSITLTVPDNYTSTANQVTYAYDSSTSGNTAKCFYRMPGDASSTAARTIHVRSVSTFEFKRFNRLDDTAANDGETKRIQISLNVRRQQSMLAVANTVLVSSSTVLRNKLIE